MRTHVTICLLIGVVTGAAWVKVANFYDASITGGVYEEYDKTAADLIVLVADTKQNVVRIPMRDIGYYDISKTWTQLNETMVFGRLSFFVIDYANVEIEHDILRFEGNMNLSQDHRSLMTVVKNDLGFRGSLCNMGASSPVLHVVVNLCLHGVVDSGISRESVQVIASPFPCTKGTECEKYPSVHEKGSSLEFALPGDHKTWNLTITGYKEQSNKPTTLCQFTKSLSQGYLNTVVMKPNNTVQTWFECVVFSEKMDGADSLESWLPVVLGLVAVAILIVAVILINRFCSRPCIRGMLPTPDQDPGPYRSFGESAESESPTYATYATYREEPDKKYLGKMETQKYPNQYTTNEERPYARI